MEKESKTLKDNNKKIKVLDVPGQPFYDEEDQSSVGDDDKYRVKLTPTQEKIVEAIEKSDKFVFEKFGGSDSFDINFNITSEGIFPLLVASAKGDKEMVQLMLKNKNIEIDKTDQFGVNAFWIAAFYGKIDVNNYTSLIFLQVMKLLVSKGIDLMCKNQNGSNALHIAVKKENIPVIQTLIDIHYPLSYAKNNGVTPIGIAAYKGNLKILDMLFKAGADVNQVTKQGVSPLYLAIKSGSYECIKYLINNKAKVHFNDVNQLEFSPLFYAVKLGNLQALELICDTGINIDEVYNQQGYTPFTYAASLHQIDLVNYLSIRVHNMNQEDPEGFTVFSRYVILQNFDMANKLLSRGGVETLEYCNRDGRTPLTLAIQYDKKEAVTYLISKGADPHIMDLQGMDSCDHALKNKIFMNQPFFTNCKPALRRKPKMKFYNQQELKEKQEVLDFANDKLHLLNGKSITGIPDSPNNNIVPLRNISLPQIDQMLEERNISIHDNARKILKRDKNVDEILKFNQSIREIDQNFRKQKMQAEASMNHTYQTNFYDEKQTESGVNQSQASISASKYSESELKQKLETYSSKRSQRNEMLKQKREQEIAGISKQKEQLKLELRSSIQQNIIKDPKYGPQNDIKQHRQMDNNFWETQKRENELKYENTLRNSREKLEQLKNPDNFISKNNRSPHIKYNNNYDLNVPQNVEDNQEMHQINNQDSANNFQDQQRKANPFQDERIKGFDKIRDSLQDMSQSMRQREPYHSRQGQIQQEGKYAHNNSDLWIDDVSRNAAEHLSKLRYDIEKEIRQAKRDQHQNSSIVEGELQQAQNLYQTEQFRNQQINGMKSNNFLKDLSTNDSQFLNPNIEIPQSQHVHLNSLRLKIEQGSRNTNEDVVNGRSLNYRNPVLTQLAKKIHNDQTQDQFYNTPQIQDRNNVKLQMNRSYREEDIQKSRTPDLIQSKRSFQPYIENQQQVQFTQNHLNSNEIIGQNFIQQRNYLHLPKMKEFKGYQSRLEEYQNFLLHPKLRQNNFEEQYTYQPSEVYQQMKTQEEMVRKLKSDKELKYQQQQQELLNKLRKKLDDIDGQVDQSLSQIKPKHNHSQHRLRRPNHILYDGLSNHNKTLDYDRQSRRNIPTKTVNLLNTLNQRKQSEKPRSIAKTGEFILYTDLRANSKDRQCCSNSNSPDHDHNHYDPYENDGYTNRTKKQFMEQEQEGW